VLEPQPATGAGGLTLHDVTKRFEIGPEAVEVLRGVSLELASGEALAVTGPSGSGKSTLLHILGALEPPSSGAVRIAGEDPFLRSEPELARFRNRVVGFVFQDHYLLPQYSVLENVLIPTLASSEPGRGDEPWARALLARVGLAEISGGERQRAAVARALVNHPQLLLCDEPTGNLDRASAASVTDLLFELHREEGNILVVVTHSLELASRFPRQARLADGLLTVGA
jgi:lipoprotein-releasing system ATP-binding protein